MSQKKFYDQLRHSINEALFIILYKIDAKIPFFNFPSPD